MKTQKSILSLALFLICTIAVAQESIEKEVNNQVWKPFIESWTNNDHVAFNALHTDDVLRVSSRGIQIGSEYKERNTSAMLENSNSKAERSIQFWLEHRVYSGSTGYEVGYYKITNQWPGQDKKSYYARFHIVLKKTNGQWKIAQDWDTSSINGHEVTEEDWLKGKALDF